MNFWANRLGATPKQDPQQPPQPAASRPWWATPPPPPAVPVQQPPALPQQQPQQASVAPAGESNFGDLLRQDGYTTDKAQSAKDSESCPECGSPNYMRSKESPNSMKQCFNCGWNPRFAHSTAGASGIGQKNVAPPKPARVQQMNESTFNPTHIIGRVG